MQISNKVIRNRDICNTFNKPTAIRHSRPWNLWTLSVVNGFQKGFFFAHYLDVHLHLFGKLDSEAAAPDLDFEALHFFPTTRNA